MNQIFEYQGHTVTISQQTYKKKIVYWFIIDGQTISFVYNSDTAKRLAVKLIDVVNDTHYASTRQQPMYKPGNA